MLQAGEKPTNSHKFVADTEFKHREAALDEGLRESFPASDPLAVSISYVVIHKSAIRLD
jgi:hypothetical protein